MYTPILPPNYHMGMDFLVLSFVVVVVGGMGSLTGAVAAGFMLGILQSFASMNEIKSIVPGIDQIIIYLIAVVRSEEHTSELQSLMRISYAVFCLKKKKQI